MAEYIDREAAISLIKQYGYDAIDGGRYCKKNCIDVSEEWFCKSGIRKEDKVE